MGRVADLDVQMDVGVAVQGRVEAEVFGVGAQPPQRGTDRLLHDRALPAGQGQRRCAGRVADFDEDHLAAADGGATQADGAAGSADAAGTLDVGVGGRAEHLGDTLR